MTTADMQDFVRGYDHAIQAMSEGLANQILRSFAVHDAGRRTSRWFSEGAMMAIEACERAYLVSAYCSPYRTMERP